MPQSDKATPPSNPGRHHFTVRLLVSGRKRALGWTLPAGEGASPMPRRKRLSPCHPLKPATLWIRVVSMLSARVIAGRMVASRRASIDLPAPGGPRSRDVMVGTPASGSALSSAPKVLTVIVGEQRADHYCQPACIGLCATASSLNPGLALYRDSSSNLCHARVFIDIPGYRLVHSRAFVRLQLYL
jgi:hypothetical protein